MKKSKLSDYPVFSYIDAFINMILNNQVVIVSAGTATGKTVLLPWALINSGLFKYVSCTSPTRAAASSISRFANELYGFDPDDLIIGYQTAYEKAFSTNTKVLYTTEGLELMKELYSTGDSEENVVIIDEVQEYSIPVEGLMAWVKKKIRSGWKTKVVLMSASIDAKAVSEYFDNCPILEIPGEHYPVTVEQKKAVDFIPSIQGHVRAGRGVLAFTYGRRMLFNIINELKELGVDQYADIFPFYGEMPWEAQQLIFEESSRPKVVVATNIAQTSLTIPKVSAVVDSGLERHFTNVDGLATLVIGDISVSDQIQREGRAARTGPGIYTWCNDTPIDQLKEESIPDILVNQDSFTQLVLKLASIGEDAASLEFFHQPTSDQFAKAYHTLRILGALDNDSKITPMGKIMAMLPVKPRYARMIVESEKRGVLADMVTIAALFEVGKLQSNTASYSSYTQEMRNAFLAELDLFNHLRKQGFSSNDFSERTYFRVLELRSRLYDILERIYGHEVDSSGDRTEISKSCMSGLVEYLYVKNPKGPWYKNPNDPSARTLQKSTATLPGKFILGIPGNHAYISENKQQILYLIDEPVLVDEKSLMEVAPHLLQAVVRNNFDPMSNTYTEITETQFNGVCIDSSVEPINESSAKKHLFVDWITKCTMQSEKADCLSPSIREAVAKNRAFLGENLISVGTDMVRKTYETKFSSMVVPPNLKKLEKGSNMAPILLC